MTSTFTALSILAGTLTMLRDLRLDDRALTEGLLKSEDEPDFEYALLGPAKMLITGRFEGGDMDDRGDDIVASGGVEQAHCAPSQPLQIAYRAIAAQHIPQGHRNRLCGEQSAAGAGHCEEDNRKRGAHRNRKMEF